MNAPPVSPAIQRWQARFAAEPVQAIGDLLAPTVFSLAPSRGRVPPRPWSRS